MKIDEKVVLDLLEKIQQRGRDQDTAVDDSEENDYTRGYNRGYSQGVDYIAYQISALILKLKEEG